MMLPLTPDRLTGGAHLSDGLITCPAAGGGVSLPELSGTKHRYLNLTLTVEEEHSLALELRVYGLEEDCRVLVRFGLMPRIRAHMAIDLNWLDGHILFPGHMPGTLKVVCHGSRIAREEIRRAELVSMPAFHDVHVRLEDIELSDTPRPPADMPRLPLIDEMGQYIPKTWEGKSESPEALSAALRKAADLPDAYPFPRWTSWGGCADMPLQQGTGYFSRVKRDGRWYLTDPEGCAFFSMGPDCVVARCDARIDGVESLLQWLPDENDPAWQPMFARLERPFGEIDRGPGRLFSYERTNLRRAFGEDWEEAWRGMVVRQLKQLGMNTLGNWSDETLFGRMPYVTSLPRFPETKHCIFRDFPDVLSPEYAVDAQACAKDLLLRRDDPWMIGYFLRNEPGWAFVDNLIIADEVLRDPEDTCCKRALVAGLREQYGTIGALNAAWHADFADFDALFHPMEKASALSEAAERDLRAFSERLIRAYVEIPARACREADPHHMILGMRWAWISDPALASGWECFDVFSINCYAVDPTEAIQHVCDLGVDLPVMIGEFHFGALDAGPTATGLEAVRNQEERGAAYRYYCEHAAAHPAGVGCHYFQCYDQFALGRFDGENYNIGLFDICLLPYLAMARAVHACAQGIYRVKAGLDAPVSRRPESLPMIAY